MAGAVLASRCLRFLVLHQPELLDTWRFVRRAAAASTGTAQRQRSDGRGNWAAGCEFVDSVQHSPLLAWGCEQTEPGWVLDSGYDRHDTTCFLFGRHSAFFSRAPPPGECIWVAD